MGLIELRVSSCCATAGRWPPVYTGGHGLRASSDNYYHLLCLMYRGFPTYTAYHAVYSAAVVWYTAIVYYTRLPCILIKLAGKSAPIGYCSI